jgi:hypothetical protein
MGHADFKVKVLKSVAQLEAERLTAFDELHEIADAIDLAALAVIGMAKELGGEEGEMLANYLRGQAERMRQAKEQLLTAPDESFLQPLKKNGLHSPWNELPGVDIAGKKSTTAWA